MTDQVKPNRDFSNWVWNNRYIDVLNKALIVTRIRAQEDYIATLEHDLNGAQGAILNYKYVVTYLEQAKIDLVKALEELVRDAKRMDRRLLKDVVWENAPKGSIVRAERVIQRYSIGEETKPTLLETLKAIAPFINTNWTDEDHQDPDNGGWVTLVNEAIKRYS